MSTARFPTKIRKFEKFKKCKKKRKLENSKIRKFENIKAKNARKLENSKIRKIQKMQKNARKLENSKIEKIQQQVRAFRWVGPGKKKLEPKVKLFLSTYPGKNNILEKQFKRSTKLFVLERALLSDTTGTITTTNY